MDQPATGPLPLTARRVYALAILVTIAAALTVSAVEVFVPNLFAAPDAADGAPEMARGAGEPVTPEEIVRFEGSGEHRVWLPRSGPYVVYIRGPSQFPLNIRLTEVDSGRTRQALLVTSQNQPIVNPIEVARPRFTFTLESAGDYTVDIRTWATDASYLIAIVPQAPLREEGRDTTFLVRVIQAAAIAIAARVIYNVRRRGQPWQSAPLVTEAEGYGAFLAAEYAGPHAPPPSTWWHRRLWDSWLRWPDMYVEANEAVWERRGLRRRIDIALARLDDNLPFPLAFGCAVTLPLLLGCAWLAFHFWGS